MLLMAVSALSFFTQHSFVTKLVLTVVIMGFDVATIFVVTARIFNPFSQNFIPIIDSAGKTILPHMELSNIKTDIYRNSINYGNLTNNFLGNDKTTLPFSFTDIPSGEFPEASRSYKAFINYFRSHSIISILFLCVTLCLFDRRVEYDNRLDFFWKSKFKTDREELETMGSLNKVLLENILPAHVAAHFLSQTRGFNSLYYKHHDNVSVLFASIPNFKEFWDENDVTNKGLECMRLLNEIICEFDKLLLKPKFSSVEKIKTIGSTYMAACGLSPKRESQNTLAKRESQVIIILEFALAMINSLDLINKDSFNNFQLQIGINYGPVIAGIVGAQKPQFDIWGNTVNIASRMDSHGKLRSIQITEATAKILISHGYKCDLRGPIKIKGSGIMTTYFVCLEGLKNRESRIGLISNY
ncbi:unnamed protein product [Gordionus sp. m RMFG-2023]